jgi:hypothetical protein
MIIPCPQKGGHHCGWPACPLDCPGRDQSVTSLKDVRKQKERENYSRLVMEAWDRFERADRQDFRDIRLKTEQKAKDRL